MLHYIWRLSGVFVYLGLILEVMTIYACRLFLIISRMRLFYDSHYTIYSYTNQVKIQ